MPALTDPYLTGRVEDALLGALLHEDNRRPDQRRPDPRRFRALTSGSFSTVGRQSLYAAILLPTHDPIPRHRAGTWLERVAAAAVAMAPEQYVDADTVATVESLIALRDACPAPAHLYAYARLVEIGAFRRHIAAHTDRLSHAADTESYAPRAIRLRSLAARLEQQALLHPDLADYGPSAPRSSPPDPGSEPGATPEPGVLGDTAGFTSWRAEREDELLADLIRKPSNAAAISAMLPADQLTDPRRRAVYEATLALAAADDPIDELTLAWQMAEQRAVTSQLTAAAPPAQAEADLDYLTHLDGVYPRDYRDDAVSLAETLLAEDLDDRTYELVTWSCTRSWPPARPPAPAQPLPSPQAVASWAVLDPSLIPPATASSPGPVLRPRP